MKKIIFILFILTPYLFISCNKEEETCSCNKLLTKRWYYNGIDRASVADDDCQFYEDFIFQPNGTVTFIRTGAGFDRAVFDDAMQYQHDNCNFSFSAVSDTYKSPTGFTDPSCRDVVSSFGDRIFNGAGWTYTFEPDGCSKMVHEVLGIEYIDSKPE